MHLISYFIYILLFSKSQGFHCSPGCTSECIADYTCLDSCSSGYENDHSCDHCTPFDSTLEISETNPLFYNFEGMCSLINPSKVTKKKTLIPDSITELKNEKSITLNFDSTTFYDSGPCHYKDSNNQMIYRRGHWLFIDFNKINTITKVIMFNVAHNNLSNKQDVRIDSTDSNQNDKTFRCFAMDILSSEVNSTTFPIPVPRFVTSNREHRLYFFVYVTDDQNTSVTISIKAMDNYSPRNDLVINQDIFNALMANGGSTEIILDNTQQGQNFYPACISDKLMKGHFFEQNVDSRYRIAVDVSFDNRIRFIQEVDYNDINICKQLFIGQLFGKSNTIEGYKNGLVISLDPKASKGKRYTLFTDQQDSNFSIVLSAICPDECNYDKGHGTCSTRDKKCLCEDGYGGESCILKCWHNNTWQPKGNNGNGQCYFGEKGCRDDCTCSENYILSGHHCVSEKCLSSVLSGDLECFRGTEGCLENCYCDPNDYISYFGSCKKKTCGNGQRDSILDSKGHEIGEECDGGKNCNSLCYCIEGYVPSDDDPLSCQEKSSATTYLHVGIGLLCGLIVIIFIVIIIGIILYRKIKRIDIRIFKLQQPVYYYYISGSKKVDPEVDTKFKINPVSLDFGNKDVPTEVFDTRFERMEIKNKSGNKYMLIIFHTPNNPKFVFNFEKQVTIIRPRITKEVTCYMTLHCTTKINDIKIPYSVWFSKSKHTLREITVLLKEKTFEEWTSTDQETMNRLLKKVTSRFHGSLTIDTTAASSTHIDLDELNLIEEPIAEGAMGKVYIGCYRSVPVAVKMFRWENLTEEETLNLKMDVINECVLMSKLRNPFIANYMGSVTYLPQVSMVMQYFVLGSLGEYLRKDNENFIKLPYKLKVKMLFDTARGMQFLHENRIMHLDLKPDNLLVNSLCSESPCCIKITDFGTSRFTKSSYSNEDKGLGTPIYAAPECYNDKYSFASDVYAYGVTAWEIFYEDEPYKEFKSLFEIKDYVLQGKRLKIDDFMPLNLKELIEDCWKQKPEERLGFERVCNYLVLISSSLEDASALDEGVDLSKIESLIVKRNERLNTLMNESQTK
ncbi:protein tyrosine kinase domain-containing protein [Entamoeba histolytica]|uniref:Protein tyrosine kinase domain-containing protein n=4 Tax=Entamoeba histolytica TaxID=5759 RepID=C4M9R8_ENTH1|nr:protein tyrosine kinase domain-containing protein [Entamoeba histolytica HM-1:IMSS]EAL46125.2 protein tyrosine kinase domain-containing protein [Entamoeba histolytica HM-1:IMSS]GAT98458.1 protein tyrosine kinase domain-containing protein [Entamoeba histolytica]|eukprot:XP_651511.2 protein tyrosine kinase domain-containing protein [Entamoeba histolytica HM-1:IMSS]